MANERLTVKNFGPIREADLDLRKVTVLIGEQASGKSVLAKLVAILSDITSNTSLAVRLKSYEVESFLNENTWVDFVSDKYSISIKDSSILTQKLDGLIQNTLIEIERLKQEMLHEENMFAAGQSDPYWWELMNTDLGIKGRRLRELTLNAVYVPTERILLSTLSVSLFSLLKNDVALPSFLKNFGSEFEFSRRHLKRLTYPIFDLTYSFSDSKDQILHPSGITLNLAESSSGIQSATPLILVVESKSNLNNHIFIIEEPELNLYPTTQKKLVEYLIEKCTQGDNRLIITTHSPYILTALNNCIEASNVRKLHPESEAEVDKLVPRQYQIDYEDVMAYFVADGTAKPIMNEEYQIIDANALDDVSNELGRVFDSLLDLKYQNQE